MLGTPENFPRIPLPELPLEEFPIAVVEKLSTNIFGALTDT